MINDMKVIQEAIRKEVEIQTADLQAEIAELRSERDTLKNVFEAMEEGGYIVNQQAEKRLYESQDKFSKAFYNHPTPMQIVNIKSGERVDVNDSALKLFGQKREEFQQDNIFDNNICIDFQEQKKAIEIITKERFIDNYPVDLVNKSGAIRHVLASGTMLDIGDGNQAIVSFVDITEHKQAEETLRESETHFRKLFERTDAVSVQGYDKNRRVIYWNPASEKLYGYTADNAIGKQLEDLIIPDEMREQVIEAVSAWNNGGPAIPSSELTLRKADGSPISVFSSHVMFYNQNNELEMYCIDVDLTERKRVEKELKDKEELMIAQSRHAAMGEMIGMIAHQWRQPISVIAMGANNMLVDIELDEVKPEVFKKYAHNILHQVEYLSKTIDDFRNFFRPDKEREEIKLESVMAEAQKIIGKSLEHNKITLSIKHENGYKVQTYSRELLQVYINLLKNAEAALIENRSEDRQIDVVISDDADHLITTICDNGKGIDEVIIDKIFHPYFTTKDEKTGTGLGLYMSKTIVEKHLHGTIEVSNTDEGACFKIAIPKVWSGGADDA